MVAMLKMQSTSLQRPIAVLWTSVRQDTLSLIIFFHMTSHPSGKDQVHQVNTYCTFEGGLYRGFYRRSMSHPWFFQLARAGFLFLFQLVVCVDKSWEIKLNQFKCKIEYISLLLGDIFCIVIVDRGIVTQSEPKLKLKILADLPVKWKRLLRPGIELILDTKKLRGRDMWRRRWIDWLVDWLIDWMSTV